MRKKSWGNGRKYPLGLQKVPMFWVKLKSLVPSVLVGGRVIGDIYTDKLIELAAGAVVEGNVHYNILEVAKGPR